MPREWLTPRKRLIVKHTAISLGSVLLISVLLIALRNEPRRYSPGEAVEGITSELARGVPAGYTPVQFTNVAQESGIHFRHFPGVRSTQLPEDMGSGAAWGDYDNDGDYDLFLCNIAGPLPALASGDLPADGSNRLYRNNGDGTFTDVTAASGLEYRGISMAAAWADYDADGDLDLVVTTYGRILLYRNRGQGSFEEVSRPSGLAGLQRFWAGASWGDFDRDGDPDLYVCAYVTYKFEPEFAAKTSRQFSSEVPFTLNPSSYPPEPNALFRNNGDGTFTEVAGNTGVANPDGRSLTASWCDFDLDGWPDLYVANDVSDNAMYRNKADGTFEDVSHSALVSDYRGAMGLAVGDFDSDGDFDIFITHWIAQENGLFWNMLRSGGRSAPGALRFADVADMLGLGQIALDSIGWGTSFIDFDNDGRLDLFVVNGSTFQQPDTKTLLVPMRNFLFWQKSPEEGFFEVGRLSGPVFAELHVGRGAAFADYDDDGDIDALVVNHGEAPLLLRNEAATHNHWLKVRVRGSRSPHLREGAIVELESQGKTQYEVLGAQPSYLSQNAPEAHFGLGAATTVDRIAVRFLSGSVREMRNVAANQRLLVSE